MYLNRSKKRIRLTPFGYLVVAVLFAAILFAIVLIIKLTGDSASGKESLSGSGNPLNAENPVFAESPEPSDGSVFSEFISSASAATNDPATPTPSPTAVPTPTIYIPETTYLPGDPTPSPTPAKFSRTPSPEELAGAMDGTLSTGNVNLRAGPSTNDDIIGTGFGKGTKLKVYALENDFYFVQIIAMGKYGFVSSKFVSVSGMTPEPFQMNVPENAVGGYISASKAMLRTGPGTDYSGIRVIRRNTSLYIYYQQDGWAYVEVAQTGEAGYVKADFITSNQIIPEKTPEAGLIG